MNQTYPFAPIIGCVLEVKFANPLTPALVGRAGTRVARNYFNRSDAMFGEIQVNPLTKEVNFGEEQPRIHLSSADQTERLSIQPESLVCEQLAPYPGWETFYGRFSRDWQLIDKLVRKHSVGRIGCRFINRIDIPSDESRVLPNRYVNIGISVPSQFEKQTAVQLNYQAEFGVRPFKLILNAGLAESPIPHRHAIMVDIDVISETNVPHETAAIFEMLGEMRQVKNDIFEECVTDVARHSFQG